KPPAFFYLVKQVFSNLGFKKTSISLTIYYIPLWSKKPLFFEKKQKKRKKTRFFAAGGYIGARHL
ncbi:MAG: hypothetical protein LBC60_11585, partial [Spirochaetaceae bacterium]|nr:hypothetical protein [Spirochaetaceae bacterium]